MARWNFFLETARPRAVRCADAILRRGGALTPLDGLLERYPHESRDDASPGNKGAT